ncbi:hypothetical protein [Mesorhizobium sp. M00.F.Ca.ET.217.01.1.1]|uniref:hypothetical protein n=1 Tax=Mesorhizobium sp. M00.F.Ca.ET.217.01.1.1 TaxID=2500529 RepID=UPI000FD9B48C|nr:hypothetical protein [Mesorhizobium sp. M00.F.Ca.ET.217.01.1.1]TGQ19294.1 hypothetical protein EN860_019375 [Mesorhizobium sp. M00.F.Ca.ET.217.01.1.1]
MTYPVVTATEAAAAGLRPSALFSIARFNERSGNHDVAQRARQVGRELAKLVGLDLGGRRRQRLRAANDNRTRSYGKPRSERMAA